MVYVGGGLEDRRRKENPKGGHRTEGEWAIVSVISLSCSAHTLS